MNKEDITEVSYAIRKDFGHAVRALREDKGISLRRFALMVGLSKDYLVDIEYGKKAPTLVTIKRIADGLDMKICDIFATFEDAHMIHPPKDKSRKSVIIQDDIFRGAAQ